MQALAEQFSKLIAARLAREPGSQLDGSVLYRVKSSDETLEFSHRYHGGELSWHDGGTDAPFATIEMPIETLADLVRGAIFDWRFTANVKLSTNAPYSLYYVTMLMSEPPSPVRAVFERDDLRGKEGPLELERHSSPDVARWRPSGVPALFEGLSDTFPTRTWSAAGLRSKFGQLRVGPYQVEQLFPEDDARGAYAAGEVLPSEMLEHAAFTQHPLLAELPSPEFLQALNAPRFFGGSSVRRPVCHRDPADSYLFHVFGDKEFWIAPPTAGDELYALKAYARHQPTWVDCFAPDLDHHPRSAAVQALRVRLAAGQVLFIPRGWFHAAKTHGPALSISLFKARRGDN